MACRVNNSTDRLSSRGGVTFNDWLARPASSHKASSTIHRELREVRRLSVAWGDGMTYSIAGVGGAGSPQLVSGASPYSSPSTKMTNLFQTIDTTNTSSITQQQFNAAFATLNPPGRFQAVGAAAIFKQLDPQGTGSVSKSTFVNGLTKLISSFGKSGSPSATAAAAPSQSLGQSLQSLEQLGASTSPGAVVNKQV